MEKIKDREKGANATSKRAKHAAYSTVAHAIIFSTISWGGFHHIACSAVSVISISTTARKPFIVQLPMGQA
ncbi:MAG: hypothetical protein LBF49_00030 [Puniceicoccales bacterium]|jgi:hypothetical protein|nr:hypothetical protein [Puniceicoccales bacterium]